MSQRRPELGLRMALGADQRRIRRAVVSRGIGLATVGVIVGLILAAAATRVIGAMLYGIGPLDPLSFAAAGALVLAIAAAASFIPALRASRVHPLEALRSE